MLKRLKKIDWNKWGNNVLVFSSPALFILFYQLSTGVSIQIAGNLALLVLYQSLADLFKKYKEAK